MSPDRQFMERTILVQYGTVQYNLSFCLLERDDCQLIQIRTGTGTGWRHSSHVWAAYLCVCACGSVCVTSLQYSRLFGDYFYLSLSCCAMPCSSLLHSIMLCSAVLCQAMLCYAMLYCALQCCYAAHYCLLLCSALLYCDMLCPVLLCCVPTLML